jgi:hypothetical protein
MGIPIKPRPKTLLLISVSVAPETGPEMKTAQGHTAPAPPVSSFLRHHELSCRLGQE